MGRRSANEGSIYRRKRDGLWVAQYLVDNPEGKIKRKGIYGKKRKDVADKLAEVQKEKGEGLLLDAGNLTVAELLAHGSATRCRAGSAVGASVASQETSRRPRHLGLVAIGSGANGAIDEAIQRPHEAKFA